MTKRSARFFLILPLAAGAALLAVGPLTSAARDLGLKDRIGEARVVVQDIVHEGASEVAKRTDRSGVSQPIAKRPAKRITAGSRPAPRTGPAPRSKPASLPTRNIGEQAVPDFLALQDDAREEREHSGRVPPQ